MNGKNKCKILKEIRKQIAAENDISYVTSECKHKGDCLGTCPKCEAEVRYLEQQFPGQQFAVLHAGQRIKALEKDFSEAKRALEEADMILFSYPVYTFICPAQLHRFIELMKESGIDFSDKFATQFSTSKHFYDVTAHRYIEDNCQDMGMKVIRGLSAEEAALKGIEAVETFFRSIGIPKYLEDVGVDKARVPEMAITALEDGVGATNPIATTVEECEQVYYRCFRD